MNQSIYKRNKLSCFSTAMRTVYRNLSKSKFEPEVHVLSKFLKDGDVCIDIGGAYGRYAYPMAKLVGKSGKIYSFEPGSYSYHVLSFIKSFHRLSNVDIFNKALSNKAGSIDLFCPIKKSGRIGPSLAYIGDQGDDSALKETVETVTLDDFISSKEIKKVDFIKIDVEGAEGWVFEGAVNLIQRDHPIILSEIDGKNLKPYDYSPEQLQQFFLERGYKTYILQDDQFKAIENINKEANYFFIHENHPFINQIS